jgi:hypothetical protein
LDIANVLRRLPKLEYLSWNYIDEEVEFDIDRDLDFDGERDLESALGLKQRFRTIVPIIGHQCPNLDYVQFCHEEFSWVFEIERDEESRYESCSYDYGGCLFETTLYTSAWDVRNYDHL